MGIGYMEKGATETIMREREKRKNRPFAGHLRHVFLGLPLAAVGMGQGTVVTGKRRIATIAIKIIATIVPPRPFHPMSHKRWF